MSATALDLRLPPGPLSVVAVGAHPDDVEIGAGGTLLALGARPGTSVHVVVLTGTPERAGEARTAAALFAPGSTVDTLDLPDGRLPGWWTSVKDALEEVAARVPAGLVLAPTIADAHQDHRTVAEIVPTVWRTATVLGYEIPKSGGDLGAGRPAAHVVLDDDAMTRKCALLHSAFPSQVHRPWFDDEVFRGLARLRGIECGARWAEAFSVVRWTLQP